MGAAPGFIWSVILPIFQRFSTIVEQNRASIHLSRYIRFAELHESASAHAAVEADAAEKENDHQQDKEQRQQESGDSGKTARQASKAQQPKDERSNRADNCPVEHG
jgi:hypothetical protein